MLTDLKILDFTSLLPGPYATMMLADLGANVIKIEAPNRIDIVNEVGPKIDNYSALYHALNRNKTVIQLDFNNFQDLSYVKELISEYDIIVEGFRPGVLMKFGLDYASLRELNPKLIFCSLTGYGQSSPLVEKAGHDINYLALSGIPSYSGTKNSKPPLNGIQIADIAGGSLHIVIGILSSFIHRLKTGIGQHIDVSMLDTTFSFSIFDTIQYLAGGLLPKQGMGMLNGGGIYDYYETKDGRYLSIGSLEPKFQIELYNSLGINPLNKNQEEIKAEITKIIATKTLNTWRETLTSNNLCVEPVLTLDEAIEQPHFIHRNIIGSLQTLRDRKFEFIKHPVKYSKFEPQYRVFTRQKTYQRKDSL